jgi:hypothetical protein
MSSLSIWLRSLEDLAGRRLRHRGPLGKLFRHGGQGRTPAQVQRIFLEHLGWRLGREIPAVSDEDAARVVEFLRGRLGFLH